MVAGHRKEGEAMIKSGVNYLYLFIYMRYLPGIMHRFMFKMVYYSFKSFDYNENHFDFELNKLNMYYYR